MLHISSLSWSTFYNPSKYQVEFDPPTPLVRDPANPGLNVAESLRYWGEFRSEYTIWMKSLGITLKPTSWEVYPCEMKIQQLEISSYVIILDLLSSAAFDILEWTTWSMKKEIV